MLIVGGNQSAGYEVDNSLRFDDGSSDYLSRTPASAGNRRTFTISVWVKRGDLSRQQHFAYALGATEIRFTSDNKTAFRHGGGNYGVSDAVFRDVSAWYHIVYAIDTTQATASNRVKLYVNGEQFTVTTFPTQNFDFSWNNNVEHQIGASNATEFFDGYMAEFVNIDGSQLDPTSFGEFDADSGIWKPIDVSGLTFGTNGFYLPFENSAALGQDDSGNGNNFTVNNLTSIDQTTDTPTNNSATLNTLDKNISNITLSDANLTMSTSANNYGVRGTMGVVSGKWYWESKVVTKSGTNLIAGGIAKSDWNLRYPGNTSTSIGYASNGQIYSAGNNEGAYGATYTTGDIIGVALDMDSLTLTFYKNGVSQGAVSSVFTASDFIFPAFSGQTGDVISANFGSPPFTISSGNSDANGYGNFEYAVPSGYYALNTKNLAEYG